MTYTEQAENRRHCQRLTRYSLISRLVHPQLSSHSASNETWVHEGLGMRLHKVFTIYVCVCVKYMYISIWELVEYMCVQVQI